MTLLLAHALSGRISLANAIRIIWFDAIYAIGVNLANPVLLGAF